MAANQLSREQWLIYPHHWQMGRDKKVLTRSNFLTRYNSEGEGEREAGVMSDNSVTQSICDRISGQFARWSLFKQVRFKDLLGWLTHPVPGEAGKKGGGVSGESLSEWRNSWAITDGPGPASWHDWLHLTNRTRGEAGPSLIKFGWEVARLRDVPRWRAQQAGSCLSPYGRRWFCASQLSSTSKNWTRWSTASRSSRTPSSKGRWVGQCCHGGGARMPLTGCRPVRPAAPEDARVVVYTSPLTWSTCNVQFTSLLMNLNHFCSSTHHGQVVMVWH